MRCQSCAGRRKVIRLADMEIIECPDCLARDNLRSAFHNAPFPRALELLRLAIDEAQAAAHREGLPLTPQALAYVAVEQRPVSSQIMPAPGEGAK